MTREGLENEYNEKVAALEAALAGLEEALGPLSTHDEARGLGDVAGDNIDSRLIFEKLSAAIGLHREAQDIFIHRLDAQTSHNTEQANNNSYELAGRLGQLEEIVNNTYLWRKYADKERYKLKDTGSEKKVLDAIDRLWNDINRALNYRPEKPEQSIIDKDWGNAMLTLLTDLEGQVKLEKSFSARVFDAVRDPLKDLGGPKRWIEGSWQRKVEALLSMLAKEEPYTESSDQKIARQVARDKAVAEM